MSTKIYLYFKSYPDLELIEQNVVLEHTRLFVDVEFLQKDGNWSNVRPALIDTGSPVSLIPLEIWQNSPVNFRGMTRIGGLVRKEQCTLDVKIGDIPLRFLDKENITETLTPTAYLATVDKVPLIIGFESLLKAADVHFSFSKNEAYMEFF